VILGDIQALVISVDPLAGHYESACRGRDAYTVWREVRLLPRLADDEHEEGWVFQIDRFTKSESDDVERRLREALDADARVAYSYEVDYERDTGYIHHIFDCEGY